MADPVAVITYSATPIPFTALPASVAMTSGSSTPGDGGSITAWQWYILSKPPTSAATLSAPTAASCTLQNVDVPGNYRVMLLVQNNLGDWSFSFPTPQQSGSAPYAFTTPPLSAFATIRATTRYKALQKTAYGELEWFEDGYWPVVDAVDELYGRFNLNPDRTRYAQMHDGPADADGSFNFPYNPISAAAGSFDGPVDQAVSVLQTLDVTDQPRAGLTLVLLGGVYNEDVNILLAKVPWTIWKLGDVVFDGANVLTYTADVTANLLASPHLTIDGPGSLTLTGGMAFGNPSAEIWQINIQGPAAIGPVSVSGSFLAGPAMDLEYVTFTGAVNVPNLSMSHLEWTQFPSALTCKNVQRAINCKFDDVTVTQAATVGEGGFFSCAWVSAAVFTGPAGSAKFDPVTGGNFDVAVGTFASGASWDDYLYVASTTQATSHYIRGDTGVELEATTGNIRGDAYDGDVVLTAWGANGEAALITDDGPVQLISDDVTGAGVADRRVYLESRVSSVDLYARTAGAQDVNLSLGADAGGPKIAVLQTTDGRIDITAVGGDLTLLASTAGKYPIARGPTGEADLRIDVVERDTTDGAVFVKGRGTHTSDLCTDIVAADSDGHVEILGTGTHVADLKTQYLNVERLDHPTAGFRNIEVERIAQVLDSQNLGSTAPTTGTTEELLDSYTIPDDFFTISGMMLRVTSWWAGDNNANSKTYAVKLDGVTIATVTQTTALNLVKIVVEIYAGGAAAQDSYALHCVDSAWSMAYTATTANMAGGDKVIGFYGTTPTASGDLELRSWAVEYLPTTNTS